MRHPLNVNDTFLLVANASCSCLKELQSHRRNLPCIDPSCQQLHSLMFGKLLAKMELRSVSLFVRDVEELKDGKEEVENSYINKIGLHKT